MEDTQCMKPFLLFGRQQLGLYELFHLDARLIVTPCSVAPKDLKHRARYPFDVRRHVHLQWQFRKGIVIECEIPKPTLAECGIHLVGQIAGNVNCQVLSVEIRRLQASYFLHRWLLVTDSVTQLWQK